jgi:hypothetical protein
LTGTVKICKWEHSDLNAQIHIRADSGHAEGGTTVEEVVKMLEKAQKEKLWGNLQIDFHDGEIVLVRKTETTKIITGMEKPRHNANRNGIR